MKILISDKVAASCINRLQDLGLQVANKPGIDREQLCSIVTEFDGLIVRSATKVTAEVIACADKLRVIGRAGTGVDNIDLTAATARGIAVLNSRGGNTLAAAEHAFAMLISLARNIPAAHASLASGKWERAAFVGVELFGKKLGIVGLGQIGREVATRAQAFAMGVYAYDPFLAATAFAQAGVQQLQFDEIFEKCDFVTLHLPLNASTRHLVSDELFAKSNPGLRLINVARGGVVDEEALCRALQTGRIAGAAIDVFEDEPPVKNRFVGLPNVVMTPHLGASTTDAQERIATEIAESVFNCLSGNTVDNLVNPEVLATKQNQ